MASFAWGTAVSAAGKWEGSTYVHCSTGENTRSSPRNLYISQVFLASDNSLPDMSNKVRANFLTYLKSKDINAHHCSSFGFGMPTPLDEVKALRRKFMTTMKERGHIVRETDYAGE